MSGACLMTRREVFEKADGLDERFTHALFDVDYCLRVGALGYRTVCTPLAELTWGDGEGFAGSPSPEPDATAFRKRWEKAGGIEDPYVNRNVLWPNPLSLRLD